MEVITKLEQQTGIVARDPERLKNIKTREELVTDYFENNSAYSSISYEDRIGFLQKNGYEVTRKNLIDSSLSARTPE